MTFDEFVAKFKDALTKADPDTAYHYWVADWVEGKQAHLLGRQSQTADGKFVLPCLCMEEIFSHFKKGETLGTLVFRAIRYLARKVHVDLQDCSIADFEAVKKNLVLTVYGEDFVNTTNFVGEKLCNEIFLGISLILHDSNGVHTSAVVTEQLAELWGIKKELLFRTAFENTPSYDTPAIFSLSSIAQECLCGGEIPVSPARNLLQSVPVIKNDEMLVVITTGSGTGAICMFFDNVYAWLKTAYGKFYVMPTTRYDVLVSTSAREELNLADIVDSSLDPKDVLSTKCYSSDALLRMITRLKEICLEGKFSQEKRVALGADGEATEAVLTTPLAPVSKLVADVDTLAKGVV